MIGLHQRIRTQLHALLRAMLDAAPFDPASRAAFDRVLQAIIAHDPPFAPRNDEVPLDEIRVALESTPLDTEAVRVEREKLEQLQRGGAERVLFQGLNVDVALTHENMARFGRRLAAIATGRSGGCSYTLRVDNVSIRFSHANYYDAEAKKKAAVPDMTRGLARTLLCLLSTYYSLFHLDDLRVSVKDNGELSEETLCAVEAVAKKGLDSTQPLVVERFGAVLSVVEAYRAFTTVRPAVTRDAVDAALGT